MARPRRARAALAALAVATLVVPLLPPPARARPPAGAPLHLRETGLYADPATLAIDPRNLPFSPQYPLWSDGARKRRWIFLPPGAAIDASSPDAWVFPVGTKIWKEFTFGRKVETRYLARVSRDRWIVATYAWNEEGTDAVRAPDEGIRDTAEIAPGRRHDIPGVADCRTCHEGRPIQVLGFGALQLSRDRDPGAPHAEPVTPGMVDLGTLLERGLVVNAPRAWVARPPRVAASSPTARAALGYLHANCGSCHDRSTSLDSLGMWLRQPVAPGSAADGLDGSGLLGPSKFQPPGDATGPARRVEPGVPSRSTVLVRMSTRNPMRQMPPVGTKVVDDEGVDLVRRWIGEMGGDPWFTVHQEEKP